MHAKTSALCVVLAVAALPLPAQKEAATIKAATAVDVRIDPRVELLSIVFRLAGNPEYSQGKVESYTKAVDAHFAKVKDHDAVKHARRLRGARGISYDAVAAFAVHLDGIDTLGEAVPFEPLPARLDQRWTSADARKFLEDLRDFARDGRCKEFFAAQKETYAWAEAQMKKVLAENADLGWYDRFFGPRKGARFQLVLGMLNGSGNYGPSVLKKDGSEELYAIVGCGQTDGQGRPTFDKSVVPTLIHEFCHSYCNPIVDAHGKELLPAGERIYPLVEEAMKKQAYGNARTLLCESLVRACVVRYLQTTQGEKAAVDEVKEQVGRSFFWTGELAQLLAEYEGKRGEYPTLDKFAPRLAVFFAEQADKLAAEVAKRPKVVSMVPANGQQDVDPATTALVITFDRPMLDQNWSVVGGGEHYPKTTGKPSYDKERKVLTVPVELKPDWSYELWLNRGRFNSFRGADGGVLEPVHVTFRTRK